MRRVRSTTAPLSLLVVLVAATLFLVGCGAKIDTVLRVGADGAGERVMTLTLAAGNVSELVGGIAAADASISGRLPSQLSYSGLQTATDGSLTATLTLAFVSPAEYVEKAESLLALSAQSAEAPVFAIADSLLVRGLTIDESYTSASLLRWLFAGLVQDGVVRSSTSESNMYEVGSTVLEYGGEQYPQSSGRVRAELVDDSGFASVSMATDISDVNHVTRSVTYLPDPAVDATVYEEFLDSATPEGGELLREGESWVLSFSGTPAQIANATDDALATTGSVFSLDVEPVPGDAASLLITVNDSTSCAEVCSEAAPPLADEVDGGEWASPVTMDATRSEPIAIEYVPDFLKVAQRVDFGLLGGVTATTEFTVNSDGAELVGNGFEEFLAPEASSASVSKAVDGDLTVFTVVVEGEDTQAFSVAYAAWASAGGLLSTSGLGSNIFGSTDRVAFSPGLSSVTGAHAVRNGTPTAIHLPFGRWVSAGSADGEALGEPVRFEQRGLTFAGLLLVGAGALFVIGAVLLLIRYRRRMPSRVHMILRPPAVEADEEARTSLLEFPAQNVAQPLRASLIGATFPSHVVSRVRLTQLQSAAHSAPPPGGLLRNPPPPSPTQPRPSLLDRPGG